MTEIDNIERLFKANYTQLYSLAFMMLKDEAMSHDAVHDVFADLLQSRGKQAVGLGYLMRCVRNRCLNIIRDLPMKESVERLIMTSEGAESFYDASEEENNMERIRSIISKELPPQCSRAMLLRFESQLSYSDIAEEMGVSKVAVYKHLKHGLDYIRKNLNL